MTYTYTIFDAPPAEGGSTAWPTHTEIDVEADSPEHALSLALEEARSEGVACGEYSSGDRLWAIVWEDGICVESGSVLVEAP